MLKKIVGRLIRTISPIKYAKFIGVFVGEKTYIGTVHFGSEPYLIKIGNNCGIARDVHFHTHGGARVARSKHPNFDFFGKIIIEDNAYVGAGSHLLPGITIGKGSLVGAGSVVTKSVPPGVVVAGNPARQICDIDTFIEKNQKYNLNTKLLSSKAKKEYLLSLSDDMFVRK